MFYEQSEYDIRFEWGLAGLEALLPTSHVVVIVDVLSFTTCVDVATARRALVYPYRWRDDSSEEFVRQVGGIMAGSSRIPGAFSLSAASLLQIPAGTRLVLPSPNGSTLSTATGSTPTFAGCLRNARAVAQAALQTGQRITVIAGGERWPGGNVPHQGSLRPALEDLLGAGAIIHHLAGFLEGSVRSRALSPEAQSAAEAFAAARADLFDRLRRCSSGKELLERNRENDVRLAAELDVSPCAPRLIDGAYQMVAPEEA